MLILLCVWWTQCTRVRIIYIYIPDSFRLSKHPVFQKVLSGLLSSVSTPNTKPMCIHVLMWGQKISCLVLSHCHFISLIISECKALVRNRCRHFPILLSNLQITFHRIKITLTSTEQPCSSGLENGTPYMKYLGNIPQGLTLRLCLWLQLMGNVFIHLGGCWVGWCTFVGERSNFLLSIAQITFVVS